MINIKKIIIILNLILITIFTACSSTKTAETDDSEDTIINTEKVESTVKLKIQTSKYYKEISDKVIIDDIIAKINELKYTSNSDIDVNGWQYRIEGYNDKDELLFDIAFSDEVVIIDDTTNYSLNKSSTQILEDIYNNIEVDEKTIVQ